MSGGYVRPAAKARMLTLRQKSNGFEGNQSGAATNSSVGKGRQAPTTSEDVGSLPADFSLSNTKHDSKGEAVANTLPKDPNTDADTDPAEYGRSGRRHGESGRAPEPRDRPAAAQRWSGSPSALISISTSS